LKFEPVIYKNMRMIILNFEDSIRVCIVLMLVLLVAIFYTPIPNTNAKFIINGYTNKINYKNTSNIVVFK